MDPVGDVSDRHLLDRFILIEAMPHVPSDTAVEFADAIGRARQPERQHRHAKRLPLVLRIDPAQFHHLVK